MKKSDLRNVMCNVADLGLTDLEAKKFILGLCADQRYKVERSRDLFITNCSIFYCGQRSKHLLMKNELTVDEVIEWEQNFIENYIHS